MLKVHRYLFFSLALIQSLAFASGVVEPNLCLQTFFPFTYESLVPDLRNQRVEEINAGELMAYGKNFQAEVDFEHETIRVYSDRGRVFPEAKHRILWLHGLGATSSRHTSMLEMISQLGDPVEVEGRRVGSKKSTKRKIRNLENFVQIASEAIDLPGAVLPHGLGPNMLDFMELDAVAEWLVSYIKAAKKVAPEIPFTLAAKSASPLFAIAALPEIRSLIDSLVLISPQLPSKDPVLRAVQRLGLKNASAQNHFEVEWDVINWVDSLNIRGPWQAQEFLGIPTLILTGAEDLEVSAQEKAYYQNLAENNANITYRDISGAGHSTFSTNLNLNPHLPKIKQAGLLSYEVLLDFLAAQPRPRSSLSK